MRQKSSWDLLPETVTPLLLPLVFHLFELKSRPETLFPEIIKINYYELANVHIAVNELLPAKINPDVVADKAGTVRKKQDISCLNIFQLLFRHYFFAGVI